MYNRNNKGRRFLVETGYRKRSVPTSPKNSSPVSQKNGRDRGIHRPAPHVHDTHRRDRFYYPFSSRAANTPHPSFRGEALTLALRKSRSPFAITFRTAPSAEAFDSTRSISDNRIRRANTVKVVFVSFPRIADSVILRYHPLIQIAHNGTLSVFRWAYKRHTQPQKDK